MAETKAQNAPSTRPATQQQSQQRAMARRSEYARDLFSSPFSMMRRLTEEMDRAFASTFGLHPRFGESGMWSPAIEVRERNNQLEIACELPGLGKDDVKVEMTDEGIVIQGEKKQESESEEAGVHRSERSYGRFYRMIPLPESAKADQAKAEFKDGILRIRVPMQEHEAHKRQIPIST
jgi:HSP20 family protein